MTVPLEWLIAVLDDIITGKRPKPTIIPGHYI